MRFVPNVRGRLPSRNRSGGGPEENETYVVVIHGQNEEASWHEADENLDDMCLTYQNSDGDTLTCALTTQPLTIDGRRIYFTKPNFKGTCSVAADTLLSSDTYIPPREREDDDPFDEPVDEAVLKLWGSKKTLTRLNEAMRLRKLLEPHKESTRDLLLKLGAGAGIGFMAAQYLAGAA